MAALTKQQHIQEQSNACTCTHTAVRAVDDVTTDVGGILVKGIEHHLSASQEALAAVDQHQPHQEAKLPDRKV